MNAISNFASLAWARVVAWISALNRALTTPAPLETDGFARHDDGAIFQRREF